MGPLHGIKIIEFAALGPAPMGVMILPTWAPRSCASSASGRRAPSRHPSL